MFRFGTHFFFIIVFFFLSLIISSNMSNSLIKSLIQSVLHSNSWELENNWAYFELQLLNHPSAIKPGHCFGIVKIAEHNSPFHQNLNTSWCFTPNIVLSASANFYERQGSRPAYKLHIEKIYESEIKYIK